MQKICSDGHNTHDASRRTMAGGGIDFAAHYYPNSLNTTNRSIVFIMFYLIFAPSLYLLPVLRVHFPSDRSLRQVDPV
mgnify:FL=1